VNFFPRAISRPPLVCNHQRFSLWKWRRLRGAGQCAAVCAIRRPLQDGQTPRPLHEKATTKGLPRSGLIQT
jgi:hypothetical protein